MTRMHAIAIYGTSRYRKKVKVTYKTRVWKRRSDGIKQRYRKTVTRRISKNVKGGKRFTIYGDAKDVSEATRLVHEGQWIPKKMYTDRVSAKGFLSNPKLYARKGVWQDFNEKES